MSNGIIFAGWIQALGTFLPTSTLAAIAVYGLTNWRRQLLEQRQVDRRIERAEACLVAADDVVRAIRSARGAAYLTQDEVDTAGSLDKAARQYEERELLRAIDAFRAFHQVYRRASFFLEMPVPDTDQEFGACLDSLERAFRLARFWEKHSDDGLDRHARQQVAKFRGEFLGKPSEGFDPRHPIPADAIEQRISAGLEALEDKLLPVTGGQRRPRS